ncbi:MAG: hypothetical protein AAF567_25650 [Actinomycetota bacterium]
METLPEPCEDATVVFVDRRGRRNVYPVSEIRWHAFLHPPDGLGMLLEVRSGDRPLASDEVEEREHLWDDGGQGGAFDGSWLAATSKTPLSFSDPMTFAVDDPDDPTSTGLADLLRSSARSDDDQDGATDSSTERDLSFWLYWVAEHLLTHSHRIRFSPCADSSLWHLDWQGVVGDWIGHRPVHHPSAEQHVVWELETLVRFAVAGCVTFGGVTVPDGMTESDAIAQLRALTSDSDRFEFVDGRYVLVNGPSAVGARPEAEA